MQIYLDHSATTPTRPEVVSYLVKVLTEQYGNPSSLHSWGQNASTALEKARMQIASLINAESPDSIIFTSGETESNNLIIQGVTSQFREPRHTITSSVEHPAVTAPAKKLLDKGWEVTFLPVDRQGRVSIEELEKAIRPDTALISIIYGQSEVGTLQPIDQLAQIARKHNILFHSDAVQVAGRIPIDVQALSVDFLSLSSHKLYGPQGVGALYLKPGTTLKPQMLGGGQEQGLRSGTQAVAIIAAFGLAAQLALEDLVSESARLEQLRDHLFGLLSDCPLLSPSGDLNFRLPHHLSFLVNSPLEGLTFNSRTLVRKMNAAGIGISAGSACSSGKATPSPILLAMGYDHMQATSGIRLTLGRQNSLEDIEWTATVLKQILEGIFVKA